MVGVFASHGCHFDASKLVQHNMLTRGLDTEKRLRSDLVYCRNRRELIHASS